MTTTDVATIEQSRQLTAADLRSHVNLVQEAMKAVMKQDTHYGTIPGTPKPTLFKPGAEVLGSMFRIAVSYRVEEISTDDRVRYRVTAIGTHQTTNIVMGEGMGECSTDEEKYKWRKAASDNEFNAAAENRRRVKYGKSYTANQVRTEPADLANTVLKMACKRAQVAMILNVTAASDCFTQDIEDLPEELREHQVGSGGETKRDTTLKPYDDEKFQKNMPSWKALVDAKTRTPAEIITSLASKAILSDEQKKAIEALVPKAADGEQQAGTEVAKSDAPAAVEGESKPVNEKPKVTYAIVEEKLTKARKKKDMDMLDAEADLIGEVDDPAQRVELSELYKKLKAELAPK